MELVVHKVHKAQESWYLLCGSNWEVVVRVVVTEFVPSLARASRPQGCRVNLRVLVVVYVDRDMGQLFMQDNPSTSKAYWEATISPSSPLPAQLPVTALLTGLCVEGGPGGFHAVD